MKVIKKIFGVLFAIIAAIFVLFSLLLVTPIYLTIFKLGGKKADNTAHALSRIWASWVLLSSGVILKVHNKRIISPDKTYVFVSNHRSHLDIPVCARATTTTFKFLAKEELTKAPLLGYIIKKLYITVRRQSIRDKVMALKKMEDSLHNGVSVWLFPEGTRNKSTEILTEFQDGAFTVAVNTGTPIAILTIYDTSKILQPGVLFELMPGKVCAWWEDVIETTGLTRKDIPALKDRVKELMAQRIMSLDNGYEERMLQN
jgi:1-acyl-sn-glycerol-3-phosphate acyltransferase